MGRRAIILLIALPLVACGGLAPRSQPDQPATEESDASADALVVDDGGEGSSDGSSDGSSEAPAQPTTQSPTEAPPPPSEESTEAPPPDQPEEPAAPPATGFTLSNVGFMTPESMLHDPVADVYLVSNVNGQPSTVDGNGFIAQVSPDGAVMNLMWIAGGANGVTLDAPKGMTLTDTELWVTDITFVRTFDRATGAPTGSIEVTGASFLNDAATAPDGAVWITDSSTGAVYRIGEDRNAVLMTTVAGVNGIAFFNANPLVTSGQSILQIAADGSTSEVEPVPTGGLDGLVVLRNGALVVSSWSGGNVYLIHSAGTDELVGGINGPADIGIDEGRMLILIPHFQQHAVQAVPLP